MADGERGQDPGPRRGGDRVGLLQAPQALGLGLGGQGGRVGGGQVAQAGPSGRTSFDLLFEFSNPY